MTVPVEPFLNVIENILCLPCEISFLMMNKKGEREKENKSELLII